MSEFTSAEVATLEKEKELETSLLFLPTRGLLVTIMATACAAITQYVHHACQSCGVLTIVIGDGSNQQSMPALFWSGRMILALILIVICF